MLPPKKQKAVDPNPYYNTYSYPQPMSRRSDSESGGMPAITCRACGEDFCTFESFKTHLEYNFVDERVSGHDWSTVCATCGDTYTSLETLRLHCIENAHDAAASIYYMNAYSCCCGESYDRAENLLRHYEEMGHLPGGGKTFKCFVCMDCGESYDCAAQLVMHCRDNEEGHEMEEVKALLEPGERQEAFPAREAADPRADAHAHGGGGGGGEGSEEGSSEADAALQRAIGRHERLRRRGILQRVAAWRAAEEEPRSNTPAPTPPSSAEAAEAEAASLPETKRKRRRSTGSRRSSRVMFKSNPDSFLLASGSGGGAGGALTAPLDMSSLDAALVGAAAPLEGGAGYTRRIETDSEYAHWGEKDGTARRGEAEEKGGGESTADRGGDRGGVAGEGEGELDGSESCTGSSSGDDEGDESDEEGELELAELDDDALRRRALAGIERTERRRRVQLAEGMQQDGYPDNFKKEGLRRRGQTKRAPGKGRHDYVLGKGRVPYALQEGETEASVYNTRYRHSHVSHAFVYGTDMAQIEEKYSPHKHEITEQDIRTFWRDNRVEVIVILEGVNPITSATCQARHSYTINDVAFNARPAECVTEGRHGQCVIDFANYHDVHHLDPNVDYDNQPWHIQSH